MSRSLISGGAGHGARPPRTHLPRHVWQSHGDFLGSAAVRAAGQASVMGPSGAGDGLEGVRPPR